MIASLSWFFYKNNSTNGGSIANPSWKDVEPILQEILFGKGGVTLNWANEDGTVLRNFQIQADSGAFLITLGTDDTESYEVRSFSNPNRSGAMIELLGELWDEGSVCRDPNIARRMAAEFYESGTVESELLC